MAAKLIVLGAGKIGQAIVNLLSASGDYELTVVDSDAAALARVEKFSVRTENVPFTEKAALRRAIEGHRFAVSASPFHFTRHVAEAAKAVGAHYFDLTEDVATTKAIKAIATDAATVLMPQCGLAPGYVSVAANALCARFDTLRDVQMRVGALPIYPTNSLKYNLTWSTDGLINEYCNPCEAIIDGRLVETLALEEVEALSIDGVSYEAFNTSGGLGTLCDSLAGKVETLNYKTIRYPGHRDIIKTLVHDLRLGLRRDLFRDVLERAIPITLQDVVIVFITVSGSSGGRLTQETYAKKVYGQTVNGEHLSAIQLTTASGICAMVDLVREGKLPARGFVRQEDVLLADFHANRFGQIYR
jgi:saccharopine dehydrogenase-like NADP-dependent oxidoreductase